METGVGVEPSQLPGDRSLDAGMGVAQGGDVVDDVEVRAAVGGQEVMAPTTLDAGRVGVVVLLHGREHGVAPVEQVRPLSQAGGREAEERCGVGGERQPA